MNSIEESVMQAIGEASMCWNPTPTGVFDSENAARIGDELILDAFNRIQSTAYSYASDFITLEPSDALVVKSGIEELAKLRSINAELLEALEGLYEAYCRASMSLSRAERHEDRMRLIAARAAIAKAKGEAQ